MGDVVGTLVGSIVSGGATGIIGVIVQRIADYKNKQLDLAISKEKMAHEIALKKIDAEILAQEYAARVTVAASESNAKIEVADSQAFAASFVEPKMYSEGTGKSGLQSFAFVLLDLIRGVVRPGLTIYLCVITTYVYLQVKELMGVPLDPTKGMDLLNQIVGTILYLTTTCLLWWFGVRNKQPAPKK